MRVLHSAEHLETGPIQTGDLVIEGLSLRPRRAPEAPVGAAVPLLFWRRSIWLVGVDGGCLLAGGGLAGLIVHASSRTPLTRLPLGAAAVVLWLVVFATVGLYAPSRHSDWEESRRTVEAASVAMILIDLLGAAAGRDIAAAWIGVAWPSTVALELVCRQGWRAYTRSLQARGDLALRTLIVGTGEEAAAIAHSLQEASTGFLPLGYVSVVGQPPCQDGLPVLSGLEDLSRLVTEQRVECIFISSTGLPAKTVSQVMRVARQAGPRVYIAANLPSMIPFRVEVHRLGPATVFSIRARRLTGVQAAFKRGFDLVVGTAMLLLVLPICLLIVLAIRVTSPGPALLRQARVTRGGRVFKMYKFRTMRKEADQILSEQGLDKSELFFKLPDDPRVTRVGRVLRRYSLDELPQLMNVVRGQMSLVGPRPLIVEQVVRNLDVLAPRHEVPAGMTGWWQIRGRNDLSPDESVQFDLFYIENWSLSLDVYILLKTVGAVLSRKGAY